MTKNWKKKKSQKVIKKQKKSIKKIIGWWLAISALLIGHRVYDLASAPNEPKKCNFTYPFEYEGNTINIDILADEEAKLNITQQGGYMNDASCLNKTPVYAIAHITSEADISAAIGFAKRNNLKISPAGKQHTMWWHTFSKGGLVLDMKWYKQVSVDQEAMTMRVESGATWQLVQQKLDPLDLAVKSMQSINLFTIWWSLSANAHGIAHNPGQIAPTIVSMRVMLASGEIIETSPTKNPELFGAVLGGYGLHGIILDVVFNIVQNEMYEWEKSYIDYTEFETYYKNNVIWNDDVALFYGRLSIAPGKNYLKETAIHKYSITENQEIIPIKPASKVALKRFIFNFSKTGDIWRWLRWFLEKNVESGGHTCVSRNEAMSDSDEIICLASRNQKMNQAMEYLDNKQQDTNILQEYFIPLENTTWFIDDLRDIVSNWETNLLNVTIRIVTKDTITALPYAKDDRIAFVLYFNQKLNKQDSQKLKIATQKIIDASIKHGGTYYLPYQLYYSDQQLRMAYPEIDNFFDLKKQHDPDELFSNTFYETYKPTE